MIRLIKDVVYTTKEKDIYVDKTIKSEPFELEKAKEKELVDRGLAEYVEAKAKSANEAKPTKAKK